MKKILPLLVSLFAFASCGTPVDIINPDAKFLYFYGSTCPHCQELNTYMQDNDLYNKLSLEKREVYFNQENNKMFLEKAKELGIPEKEVAVPFVLNKETNTYTVGAPAAIEQFEADIAERAQTTSNTGATLSGTTLSGAIEQ